MAAVANQRNDFTAPVRDALARRVGFRCSNPNCRQTTSGPAQDPEKTVNMGVAAHITAASAGGPRYNKSLTPQQRSSVENGIWLCQNHAKLIDADEARFTVPLLQQWKRDAEQEANRQLTGGTISREREAASVRNIADGEVSGGLVQARSINGGVHFHPAAPAPERLANGLRDLRRCRHYFQVGCQLGDRMGLLPLSEVGLRNYEDFLGVARGIGLNSPELSELAEIGTKLAGLSGAGPEGRALVMSYARLVDAVDQQLESQASQDELFWLMFGKRLYRALSMRVLAVRLAESDADDGATHDARGDWTDARADLEMLARTAAMPTTTGQELDRFLADFDSLESLESVWDSGQQLARHCERMLALAAATGTLANTP